MQVSSYATIDEVACNSNIIPFDDSEIKEVTIDNKEDINMLFMVNETAIFKDGKGINREVTYLDLIHSDRILKHKILTCNDAEFLVGRIFLSSLDTPDIAVIPFTPEQYAVDLPNLTESKLEQISKPQSLNSDQQEFMELHYKLSHLPLLAMITLAEKGRIQKKFAKLKHQLPICMSCVFGTAHRKPWRSKSSKGSIRKESNNAPRKCVSMDQLVLALPGLIPKNGWFLK
jgi:hypothetical protein